MFKDILIPESVVKRVLASKRFKDYMTRLEEVTAAIEASSPDDFLSLQELGNQMLERAEKFEARIHEGLVTESDLAQEHEQNESEILPRLEALFPFVAEAQAEIKTDYAMSFIDYWWRKRKLQ